MRVIVCGSRTFPDRTPVNTILDGLGQPVGDLTVISGGATGADTYAHDWAVAHKVESIVLPADWATHGRAAGPIRNQEMLETEPDLVVAFVNKPLAKSVGTFDMVRRARGAGVPTWVVEVLPPRPFDS